MKRKIFSILFALVLVLGLAATPVLAARADQDLLTDDRAIEVKAWQTYAPDEDIDFDAEPVWYEPGDYTVNAPDGNGREPFFNVSQVTGNGKVIHDTMYFFYAVPDHKDYVLIYDKKLDLHVAQGCSIDYEYPEGVQKRVVVQAYAKFDASGNYEWWVQRADYFRWTEDGIEWFVTNYYVTWLLAESQPDVEDIAGSLERANPGGQPKGK